MPPTPNITLIIPAYQEANRISGSLERLSEYLAVHYFGDVEVLAVTFIKEVGKHVGPMAFLSIYVEMELDTVVYPVKILVNKG